MFQYILLICYIRLSVISIISYGLSLHINLSLSFKLLLANLYVSLLAITATSPRNANEYLPRSQTLKWHQTDLCNVRHRADLAKDSVDNQTGQEAGQVSNVVDLGGGA